MTRIGLLSDTHGDLDPRVLKFFADCDELWHAGDVGSLAVLDELERHKLVRAVWGNIDGPEIRARMPEVQRFTLDGVDVWIEHILGYPGRWAKGVGARLRQAPPALLVAGHSHILKIQRDPKLGLLYLNPGACGHQGFHTMRTLLRFELATGVVKNMQIVELGARGMPSRG